MGCGGNGAHGGLQVYAPHSRSAKPNLEDRYVKHAFRKVTHSLYECSLGI